MALHTPLRRTAATVTSSTTTTSTFSRLPTNTTANGTTFVCTQCRHATLLRRPKRPYTFSQLITLSDGSTFLHRTTSPTPVYRTTRDSRNSLLWNPSSSKLMNVEEDEAGRLAAFRARFGRSWDANMKPEDDDAPPAAAAGGKKMDAAARTKQAEQDAAAKKAEEEQAKADQAEEDNLLDLISSFGQEESMPASSSGKKRK